EEGQTYDEVTAQLEPGAAVVLYTDGIVEARHGGELYGNERLQEVLAGNAGAEAEQLAKAVVADARGFGGGELSDDGAVVAVDRATRAPAGTKVHLVVDLNRPKVRAYVAAIGRRFDRDPVDSTLSLHGVQPFLTKEHAGRKLRRRWAFGTIVDALAANRRKPVRLSMRQLPPTTTRANWGPVIVIH